MANSPGVINGGNKQASFLLFGGNFINNNNKNIMIINKKTVIITWMLVGVAVSCMLLYNYAYPFDLLPSSYQSARVSPFIKSKQGTLVKDSLESYLVNDKNLDGILKNASMEDNTVIITTLNHAWLEPGSIFDLFLESFRTGNGTQGLLKHLVVVAMDKKAYERCKLLHPHCYALRTGLKSSSEAYFMTSEYLQMMWIRIRFLNYILEKGYNFVFTDTDIMWLRNPFPHFHQDGDFQIACDYYNGNPYDVKNMPNGGFTFVKSNYRTIQFYRLWYSAHYFYTKLHDQDVFNRIKDRPYITKIGMKIRFLDTQYFGGFCEPGRDLNQVCTMHANCCYGLANKVHDLKILVDDWKRFLAMSPDQKELQKPGWSVPQKCRIDSGSYRPPPTSSSDKLTKL